MLKLRGFSIVEVMATITIMGILAVMTAPQYWNLQDRDKYRSGTQEFFDTIIDARNAAVTNKKCHDGQTAHAWGVVMFPVSVGYNYRLRCYSAGVPPIIEEYEKITAQQNADELMTPQNVKINTVDFNESNPPEEMSSGDLDEITFKFLTGGGQGKLEYKKDPNPLQKAASVRVVLGYTNGDFSQTLCFNRVAGFPMLNKSGDSCPTLTP